MAFNLLADYQKLPGIPPGLLPKLQKLVGTRYADLLMHLPLGGVDRRNLTTVGAAAQADMATIRVTIDNVHVPHRASRAPLKIDASDGTGSLQLVFFNYSPWLIKRFKVGEALIVSGKIEGFLTEKQIVHPEMFSVTEDLADIARIWPTYGLTSGITQNMMGKAINWTYHAFAEQFKVQQLAEWLPQSLLSAQNWPSFTEAMAAQHHPQNLNAYQPGAASRQRLAFDELLAWQIALLKARDETKQQRGIAHPPAPKLRRALLDSLPFKLTGDQEKVITEIDADMMRPIPMLRLLQGDVGAGKTLVAFAAVLRAVEAGFQAAMMAPTEILSTQHFENAQKFLTPLGVRSLLVTGKMKASEKKAARAAIEAGEVDVVFGTHALIQDGIDFKHLSLVVIDEQHRFGVRQRLALSSKGETPDVLVMTATPIPRTLSLTQYGDMDVSLLKEKPPGRQPIKTTVMSLEKIGDVAAALRRLFTEGAQVYWVCPLVEESEKSDLMAATQRFEELQRVYGEQVGLLHGRMKSAEKDDIMHRFKAGEFKLLVSTTVIEVGVDVPQATTMIIEHAERFGLAQLHQLRGRVGRGTQASHCILLYGYPLGDYARERLATLRDSEDGFEIAERDLVLRGPGESLGTQQAGHIFTRIADLREDRELVPLARDVAKKLLESDLSMREQAAIDFLLKFYGRHEAAAMLHSG